MKLFFIPLVTYGAIAAVVALSASRVLPRFGKKPRFAVVFGWCVVTLFLLNILWAALPALN
jgi:hypothetical protein